MASQTLCSIQLASSYNAAMGPIYFAPLLFKCKTQGNLFLMKIAVILKVWSLMFYIYNCRYMKKTGYEFLHLDLLSQVQTHLCVFFLTQVGSISFHFHFSLGLLWKLKKKKISLWTFRNTETNPEIYLANFVC